MKKFVAAAVCLLAPVACGKKNAPSDSSELQTIETISYIKKSDVRVDASLDELLKAARSSAYQMFFIGAANPGSFGLIKGLNAFGPGELFIPKDRLLRFDLGAATESDNVTTQVITHGGNAVGSVEWDWSQNNPKDPRFTVKELCTGAYLEVCTLKIDSFYEFILEMN